MASTTMALGYAISTVIQIRRTKQGLTQDTPGHQESMNQANTAFATCMTSIALAFASISLLCRGAIARFINEPFIDKEHHIHRNFAEITMRKMPPLYMAFFIFAEIICVGTGFYSYTQINALAGKGRFSSCNLFFLALQVVLVLYTILASFSSRLQQRRRVTLFIALMPIVASLVFMGWAHGGGNVGINFGDWTYGQTFNGAAGVAGLCTTIVDWVAIKDSAVDV